MGIEALNEITVKGGLFPFCSFNSESRQTEEEMVKREYDRDKPRGKRESRKVNT